MTNKLDLTTTQELPICEAPIHAEAVIAFWEKTNVLSLAPPDGISDPHTVDPMSAKLAKQALDMAMEHPLTFLDNLHL